MIGLMGAHRTGKTTLARAYAEKQGAILVETPTSAIFKELGVSPQHKFTFSERLYIQEIILERNDLIYAAVPPGVDAIADRTPLDMLAYTMAECIGNHVQPMEQLRFALYANACFEAMSKRFSMVLLVQPGIPLVPDETKAVDNVAYMEHLNTLLLGLTCDPRMKVLNFFIPRQNLEMGDRMNCLLDASRRATQFAVTQLGNHLAAGGSIQ